MFTNVSLSMYLNFQWLPSPFYHSKNWDPIVFSEKKECPRTKKVKTGKEASKILKHLVSEFLKDKPVDEVGILISSGIDSGSIAYCLPKNTKAYFVEYSDAPTKEDKSMIQQYVSDNKLDLRLVSVTIEDYKKYIPFLTREKNSPIHPCEVPIHKACVQAKNDGIKYLFAGWGCDTYFGGMDKLMSRDYTLDSFIKRYQYVNPALVLENPIDCRAEYEKYMLDTFDTESFLEDNYHGMTMQCFFYLSELSDIQMFCPWGEIGMVDPLDIKRIRNGEPKYIIRDAFKCLVENHSTTPEKIPFTRPDYILNPHVLNKTNYSFLKDEIEYDNLTRQQKWMLFAMCTHYDVITNRKIFLDVLKKK